MSSLPLPPTSRSLWLAETSPDGDPALTEPRRADVCIVGAGLTGLSAALPLARAGKKVIVLEAGTVGGGVTGHTTGKITVLHGLVYDELRKRHGAAGARGYAAAQQAGLERTLQFIDELGIECALRTRSAYTYVRDPGQRSSIEDEVAAAQAAGLDAHLVDDTPLPYDIAAAIRIDDQAEYQARDYLLGLAGAVRELGGEIFEHTPATGLKERGGPIVRTEAGFDVAAQDVVIASHMPFLDRAGYFARLDPQRSYLIATRIPGDVPDGMFISADEPSRSVRGHVHDGEELLLVGGEGHTAGEHGDETPERYARLAAWAADTFGATEVTHRWSSQDLMPADGMPFVGRFTPLSRHVLVGAGYRKWGMTSATTAGAIIADTIVGRPHPQASLFDPWRATPHRQAKAIAETGGRTALHLVTDRVKGVGGERVEDLAPGEGRLLKLDGSVVAAHRAEDGAVSCVSSLCTHLGCRVAFNQAEQSWDCPCHGSRFAPDGTVLQGPAVRPLAPHEA